MNQQQDVPCAAGQGTLYYDGACPLCSAEMNRLRTLQDGSLSLVDIHGAPDADRPASKQVLLENLHYVTRSGEVLTGIDANVAAWQHTRLGILWRWLRWPLVRPVADYLYTIWARRRYQRLYAGSR